VRRLDHHSHQEDDFRSLGVLVVLITMSLFGLSLILMVKTLI
jgi:hypothetical protein